MPEAFCGLETVRKNAQWTLCALWEKKLLSVRDKTPQRVVCVLYHTVGAFYFSQKNTEEQNTQHSTETLSQPISQNVTATFSWNVLWILYAGGLLWVRNCAQKDSVKSVSSVRERNTLCERRNSPATFVVIISSRGCVPFLTDLHRRTEHTGFHRDIKSTDNSEPYSQHASPNTLLWLIINTQRPSPNTLLWLIINTQQPSPNTHQPIRQTHYSKLVRPSFFKINDNLRRSRAQDDVRTAHM